MAITFGNTSTGAASTANITVSHTLAAGSNYVMVVMVKREHSFDGPYSATYGGVAMTKVATFGNISGDIEVHTWEIVDVSTSEDVVITDDAGQALDKTVAVADAGTIDTTTPSDNHNDVSGGGDPASVAVTGSAGEVIVALLGFSDGGGSDLGAADGTELVRHNDPGVDGQLWAAIQHDDAANSPLEWTVPSGFQDWGISGFRLNEAAGGGGNALPILTAGALH